MLKTNYLILLLPFKSWGKTLCFQYPFPRQLKACTQILLLLLLWHRALLSLLGCRLVLNKTNVFTGEQRMLLYHIITSHFICRDLQLLQSIEEPMHFPLSKAVNIFLWTYSLLKRRHATPFLNTGHSFWWNNIWQVLEIRAAPWLFLAFVPFWVRRGYCVVFLRLFPKPRCVARLFVAVLGLAPSQVCTEG